MVKYTLTADSRAGTPPSRGASVPPWFPVQITSGGDFGGDVDTRGERA
jgi:hypothetical protein